MQLGGAGWIRLAFQPRALPLGMEELAEAFGAQDKSSLERQLSGGHREQPKGSPA